MIAESWQVVVVGGLDGECPRCGATTKHITLNWPRCQCGTCGSIHGLEGQDPRPKPAEQLALF